MGSAFFRKNGDTFYFVFRLLVGLLFMQHGLQKLFGAFGGVNGGTVQIFSLMGLAGIVELFGGALIAVGLFTRIAAFVSAAEIIVAYFKAHAPKDLIPLANGGELALLYFAAFLAVLAFGSRKWGLDNSFFRKNH
jgi:putative oxidoreductase